MTTVSQDFKSSREAGENCRLFSTMKAGYKNSAKSLLELGSKNLLSLIVDKANLRALYLLMIYCLILNNHRDLHSVTSASRWLESPFIVKAMVNYPTQANSMAPLPVYPVEEVIHVRVCFLSCTGLLTTRHHISSECKIIDVGFPLEASKLDRAFAAANLFYSYSDSENCFDIENQTDPHGLNGWDWQMKKGLHRDMVMPISYLNQNMFPPFENDEKGDQEYCLRLYGVKPRPHWTTTEFGGQRIEMVLKRFGTHHTDLRVATKDDPEWLKEQRRQEVAEIEKWISEYYTDLRQEEQAK
ncbi:hypothetical protein ISN45_Aa02g016680 [Arabidopsis thaliana x Arabidopsis arenosa]|uniref:Uncharacterized protein n=1 Tax=Arabidopsis thaliana x Arabidopsis arenosa TaxID=1240361 RepID=A0A8T2BMU1_9BRAS|nr:hypothetical protein ISN45_Aa02g016680 [Arabidopsis thaliana x Arabidopsis arenosa]